MRYLILILLLCNTAFCQKTKYPVVKQGKIDPIAVQLNLDDLSENKQDKKHNRFTEIPTPNQIGEAQIVVFENNSFGGAFTLIDGTTYYLVAVTSGVANGIGQINWTDGTVQTTANEGLGNYIPDTSQVVASTHIADSSVTSAKLDDTYIPENAGVVVTTTIADGAVGVNKLGSGVTANTPVTRYFSFDNTVWQPKDDGEDYSCTIQKLQEGTAGTGIDGNLGINLPHGCGITSFKLNWYCDDAAATSVGKLYRMSTTGSFTEMASAGHSGTGGNHTVEDTSIVNSTVDNENYSYEINIQLVANDNVDDIYFYSAVITSTMTVPFP